MSRKWEEQSLAHHQESVAAVEVELDLLEDQTIKLLE